MPTKRIGILSKFETFGAGETVQQNISLDLLFGVDNGIITGFAVRHEEIVDTEPFNEYRQFVISRAAIGSLEDEATEYVDVPGRFAFVGGQTVTEAAIKALRRHLTVTYPNTRRTDRNRTFAESMQRSEGALTEYMAWFVEPMCALVETVIASPSSIDALLQDSFYSPVFWFATEIPRGGSAFDNADDVIEIGDVLMVSSRSYAVGELSRFRMEWSETQKRGG